MVTKDVVVSQRETPLFDSSDNDDDTDSVSIDIDLDSDDLSAGATAAAAAVAEKATAEKAALVAASSRWRRRMSTLGRLRALARINSATEEELGIIDDRWGGL